ncbi:MAG: metallophosphoesterase [Pseudomonadales bacterium]|jgi:Icc-related predicted phosphoesterase|nr:metallophosphoesterase [Pseudomonadales bacterium]MDP7360642.1 metallophosphoesterase [Pseudomonadales bacterium]MDP7597942.1 metallophosphoesterase [Pseudomonadales bacterium]HJN51580.1 metallophosphoesterase [Pseudomonadales bacterium]|tara:strand:- start:5468 stop:6067 length:600 start_codon:yes stop_codon:yes gene_type:complete
MKLLLFSDVHCSVEHCQALVQMSESVDIVVAAGDIANMRSGLEETIEVLAAIGKPTILVPGNSESREELENACGKWRSATVLHGSGATVEDLQFYGLGGGIPVTPFGSWSYDFDEEQAESMLKDCPKECILVTHSPPKGAGDLSSSGQNFGSEAIRAAIIAKTPKLAVCGHIHECAGKTEQIEVTPVINAGPKGVVWEI